MIPIIDKAMIYLTRGNSDLLILAHPDAPEAGWQVPAGTVAPKEAPAKTAMRELIEETGLHDVRLIGALGRALFDMTPFGKHEHHDRHFFHAVLTGPAPDRWVHDEIHGGAAPIRFELFWWDLNAGDPDLIAGHGAMLGALRLSLRIKY